MLLGLPGVGWFTLPARGRIFLFEASDRRLQAFIFAILTAIYLGGAATHH